MSIVSGRQREALEIVRLKKAALVGRLLLGQLDGPMELVSVEKYLSMPRKELISQRDALRNSLRGEIAKFCRGNFENLESEDLVKLYDILLEHQSEWSLPRIQFEKEFGRFKPGVLDCPLHATVRISPWKLQTEYPEFCLIRDLAISFNETVDIEEHRLTPYRAKSWREKKEQTVRPEIADLIRRRDANKRACVLACFNLVEAYVNGLAWDYVQTHDISHLSGNSRNVLTEERSTASILEKLTKTPSLIAGKDPGPLDRTIDPLKSFVDIVKPHRDAIVHASPFAAPQKFGGYDKLAKLYELDVRTVRQAVHVTLALIKLIHEFVTGTNEPPSWFLPRESDGKFLFPLHG